MRTTTWKHFMMISSTVLGGLLIVGVTGVSGQQVLTEDAILAEQLSSGAAWINLSASGDQALFVAGQHSNALYVNNGDGTYVDKAKDYGIHRGYVRGDQILSHATDLNSDGCADLYVRDFITERDPDDHPSETHAIYLGNCNGTFSVWPGAPMDFVSAAALDKPRPSHSRVTAARVDGDVIVLGTDAADFIRITDSSGGIAVDVLRDGMIENVKFFAGEIERVVTFGGPGDNFVVVNPTEEVAAIFEAGPARAGDLLKEFFEQHRLEYESAQRVPPSYSLRPASGSCCDQNYTGTSGVDNFVGGCGRDTVFLLEGNDSCQLYGGSDYCNGWPGIDQLLAMTNDGQRDRLFAYGDNDRMYAADNEDDLYGGDGTSDTGYGCELIPPTGIGIEAFCDSEVEIKID